jgi:hypothetical protein
MWKKQWGLKIQMVISWYVSKLIDKLHEEYPNKERSGIARVQRREWYYEVTDIRFPKQSNHGTETEMKDWGLEALLEDIFNKTPEQLGEWKCWLHSHHRMSCFWSGTDEATKATFNDGNMDYRWSIVTAYNTKGTDYKCALNVFKPVKVEYNVPVSTWEFDEEKYLQMYGVDMEWYKSQLAQLDATYEARFDEINGDYIPTQEDVNKMLEIFNIEWTPDDIEIINNLLIKQYKQDKWSKISELHTLYKDAVQELQDSYNVDFFSGKLKELKDNIIAPPYSFGGNFWQHYAQPDYSVNYGRGRQSPLIPETPQDDTKYTNHTGVRRYSPLYGDDRE